LIVCQNTSYSNAKDGGEPSKIGAALDWEMIQSIMKII